MNREETKEKLITLCTEIFMSAGVNTNLIEYVDFIDDLGMDSITFITLIVEIEDAFNITIPDDMLLMENFKDFNSIITLICNC